MEFDDCGVWAAPIRVEVAGAVSGDGEEGV